MRFPLCLDATHALTLYAGVLTAIVGWSALTAATAPTTKFDTIDVHRINLREDDGTIRMIVADRDHFPGYVVRNQEHPHPGRADSAGMIFFNDEGTENGGLIFGGRGGESGATSFGHLSFDQYEQDQVATLEQTEENGRRRSGLTIADRPDAPLDFGAVDRLAASSPAEREAAIAKLRDAGTFGRPRAFFGKDEDRDALLALRDGEGRVRLRMRVTAAGAASLDFLDSSGKVTRSVAAAPSG